MPDTGAGAARCPLRPRAESRLPGEVDRADAPIYLTWTPRPNPIMDRTAPAASGTCVDFGFG
jgi:hypothetical protein